MNRHDGRINCFSFINTYMEKNHENRTFPEGYVDRYRFGSLRTNMRTDGLTDITHV